MRRDDGFLGFLIMLFGTRLRSLLAALVALTLFAATSPAAHAETDPAAATNNTEALGSLARLTVSPVTLNGGGKLTLISPERWSALSAEVVTTLKDAHVQLTSMFGEIPAFSTSIRLTDQESFHRATGAPKWTNALFYRGQILIPLALDTEPDMDNLRRSVRHEYTHAVVNALSAGRAPGWIDEGLAQWIEGEENPALRPALYHWLTKNDPVPLSLMQGGFTRLSPEMVPAAYAQSLFSATVVINTFGFKSIRRYFDGLRDGLDKDAAFKAGFGLDSTIFEARLTKTLHSWEAQQAVNYRKQRQQADAHQASVRG